MLRAWWLAVTAGLLFAAAAPAQTGTGPFRWQQGQVLNYQVEHLTTAAETTATSKSESKTRLNLGKRWLVQEVDAAGVATLQLSLTALRLETTNANGGTLLFDSAEPTKSDPDLAKQLGAFVGPVLAVLRVDVTGKVVEVKELKQGPASRFESEPPFVLTLAADGPRAGQEWERAYKVVVEPPQGTGEKYEAAQKYVCKSVADGLAAVSVSTAFKTQPESLLDRVPLLQMQPEGEVVFDTQTGRLHSASLKIEKELLGHQGVGSSYKFQSTYTEKYVDR